MFGLGRKEKESRSEFDANREFQNNKQGTINEKEFNYDPKFLIQYSNSLRNIKNSKEILELIYNESVQLAQIYEKNGSSLDSKWSNDIQSKKKEEISLNIINNKYSSKVFFNNPTQKDTAIFWRNNLIINKKLNPVNVSLYRLKILSYAYYTQYFIEIAKKQNKLEMAGTLKQQYSMLDSFLNNFNFENLNLYEISNNSIEISKRINWFDRILSKNSILHII